MEKNQTSPIIRRLSSPIHQAIIVLIGVISTMLLLKILKWGGAFAVNDRMFWVIAGTAILFFAIFNSVISLSVQDMDKYWTRSTASYAALMIVSGGFAYLFSSLTITEAGTFRWIFMVLTFGYLLFLSIMRFMRKIVQIAQKEDDKWMSRMK